MPFSGTSARRPLAAGTQTVKTAVTVDYAAAIEAVEYLNQLRREAGLHDLVMDENLVESAITRASECSIYYSHTRPSGESYLTACPSGSRYQSSFYSENILWGTAKVSSQRAIQSWRDSPSHYANRMDKNHQSVGIACVYARDGKSYWVQTFSSATAQVDPNPLTGTANLTFSVPVAPEMITPHVETSSYTVQMHESQDVFVLNDKSPVVPDILRSADESVVKVSLADTAVRLTAVGEGVATIYATTADGKASGSCRVTVSNPSQGSHSFTDVSQSDYFYDAVMWCADEGSWMRPAIRWGSTPPAPVQKWCTTCGNWPVLPSPSPPSTPSPIFLPFPLRSGKPFAGPWRKTSPTAPASPPSLPAWCSPGPR